MRKTHYSKDCKCVFCIATREVSKDLYIPKCVREGKVKKRSNE